MIFFDADRNKRAAKIIWRLFFCQMKKLKRNLLYKYLSPEGAVNFFNKPSIWFSLPYRLNDIFDINPIGSSGWNNLEGNAVFCLSENPASVPMWSHYAGLDQGVVLAFNKTKPFFKKHIPYKVRYRIIRPTIKDKFKSMITKSKEWSYEREWRCFADFSDGEFLQSDQVVSVPFPFDALEAIIYGHDSCVARVAEEFIKRNNLANVKEYVCRENPRGYGFDIRPIDDWSYILEQQKVCDWGLQYR